MENHPQLLRDSAAREAHAVAHTKIGSGGLLLIAATGLLAWCIANPRIWSNK